MGGLTGINGRTRRGMDIPFSGVLREDRRIVQEEQERAGVKDVPIPDSQPAGRMDRVQWSVSRETADLENAALGLIENLKKYYPGIGFHLSGAGEDMDSAKAAAGFGKGLHIVITKEFLARMQSSREEFDKCARVLSNEAAKLAGYAGTGGGKGVFLEKDRVVAWTAASGEKSAVFPASPGGTSVYPSVPDKNFKVSCHSTFNVSGHFNRMASARSSAQVQRVMGDIQYSIMSLKMTSVYGDDEQRVKAARAVRSLQKLLGRGGRKIRRLNREKLKQCARKKAQKLKHEQKSRRLELELKKMRSARKGADYTLIREGLADEAYIRGYRRYRGLHDGFTERALEAGDMVMLGTWTGEASGAGLTAADVSFSGEYSF